MYIRPASALDAKVAAPLIFNSAKTSLAALLGLQQDRQVIAFLEHAFSIPDGQFGFANHWVVEQQSSSIAVGCSWHNQLSSNFHQATLLSIHQHFGLAKTLQIVDNSRMLSQIVQPPIEDELCIGHIGVVTQWRRKGVATLLVEHFVKQAKQAGKKQLCLDVEQSNGGAIQFYQQKGFIFDSLKSPNRAAQAAGFTAHDHMLLLI